MQNMSIQAIQQNTAATSIQRAWRSTRAGITLLRQYKHEITALPHKKFQDVWERAFALNLETGLELPRRRETVKQMLQDLKIARQEYHMAKSVPFCTSLNGSSAIPHHRLVSESELPRGSRKIGHIALSPEADLQYRRMKTGSFTKQTFQAFFAELCQLEDLFPWDYSEDGCNERARLMVDLLRLRKIPLKNIRLQYICIPENSRSSYFSWNYHVAPLVELADGSKWIIDPSICRTNPLSVQTWINIQKRGRAKLSITDRGLVELGCKKKRHLFYNPSQCLMFTTKADAVMSIAPDARYIKITKVNNSDMNAHEVVTYYRLKLEEEWLDEVDGLHVDSDEESNG